MMQRVNSIHQELRLRECSRMTPERQGALFLGAELDCVTRRRALDSSYEFAPLGRSNSRRLGRNASSVPKCEADPLAEPLVVRRCELHCGDLLPGDRNSERRSP
jgi:hypothetical protein